MRKESFLAGLVIFMGVSFSMMVAHAQESDNMDSFDVDQIEAEIETSTAKSRTSAPVTEPEPEKLEDFSGLGRLAPFSEVSVIQKRYLPKTGRFEFFAGLANIVNDPWFMGIGLDARAGYHLNETWGVELGYSSITSSEKDAIKDLKSQHTVTTSSVISTKGYYGASVVWTPMYGKMGFFNRRIVPFDMYFALGAGNTQVDGGDGGSTIHLGTGQIFALSKAMGFRWDFTWNNFQATPKDQAQQSFNNLLLTLGVSFFFPEANYR
ncbi:MAG: outer membrane beta-barrel domain-containing protein [Bdellovibrio sp. CG10_big_fil_rev_8_21_14_0_10_47_8]|nr:MAG: outer membrane beta-barrel domain-containing protein [Bdellovibrio sp. CG10_big_fil_rev_8_21_14_0_10_47_8]